MSEQTFQLMRFQIFTAALSEQVGHRLSDAYVYAWDDGVYPLCDEGADWHKPFENYFKISKNMMKEIIKFLDERWTSQNVPTFYELEKHYDARGGSTEWDRSALMSACQYLYLHDSFDKDFWRKLLTPMQHPSEAASIVQKYDREKDLYFL